MQKLIGDDERYDGLFDDAEYLQGLAAADYTDWGPNGRFAWRRKYAERGARDRIVQQHGPDLLAAGMFGGSGERLELAHQKYEDFLGRNAQFY